MRDEEGMREESKDIVFFIPHPPSLLHPFAIIP